MDLGDLLTQVEIYTKDRSNTEGQMAMEFIKASKSKPVIEESLKTTKNMERELKKHNSLISKEHSNMMKSHKAY